MGYVNCMVLVMYNKWNGQTEQLWEMVQSRSLAATPPADAAPNAGESGAHNSGSPRSPGVVQNGPQQNSSGEATGGGTGGT